MLTIENIKYTKRQNNKVKDVKNYVFIIHVIIAKPDISKL